jgi:hypothetical protein
MNQTIRLSTFRKSPFHRWHLFFEHVRRTDRGLTPKILYQCWPMVLYESERELRGGRFHNFRDDPLENKVDIPYHEDDMRQQIEWIAIHADQWNAVIVPQNGDECERSADFLISYSFERPKDAVLFRLVFF